MSNQMVKLTPEKFLGDYAKSMTAEKAYLILTYALQASNYLETKAQESVNADADVIAAARLNKEDADASDIFDSHKSKVKVSKTVRAITNTMMFAELVHKWEEKQAAIESTKVPEVPALPAPVKT
mgnify:CR=1 FL=1